MNQPKIERILKFMMLLTSNVYYSVEELAQRASISVRSVYRYLDTFRSAGFVLQKEGEYFRLGKESRFFKEISQLIYFSEEEAYMIHQVIEAIDNNNVIKQNLKRKLASVYDCKIIAESIVKRGEADNIRNLIEAYQQKKQVILHHYSSANSKSMKDRLVEPFDFTTNYIEIWCYEKADERNKVFKVSRIESVELTNRPWENEELHQKGFTDIFRMNSYDGIKYPIQLQINRRAYNLLIEEFPLAERDLRQIAPEIWLLETQVSGFAGVTRFVLGLAADIEILESAGLKEYIKNYHSEFILPLMRE